MIYRNLCCCNVGKEPALPNIVTYPPGSQSKKKPEIIVTQPKTQKVKLNAQNKIKSTKKLEIIKEEIQNEAKYDKKNIQLRGSVNLGYENETENENDDSHVNRSSRRVNKTNFINNIISHEPIDITYEKNVWSITSSRSNLDIDDFAKYTNTIIKNEIDKMSSLMKIHQGTEELILEKPLEQFATVRLQEECLNKPVQSKNTIHDA